MNQKPLIDDSWYVRPDDIVVRVSSGGVVARVEDGNVLVALVREPEWSQFVLPKGGVESGEDFLTAARREILEEAGLQDLHLIRDLEVVERLTFDKSHWQTTHLFLFYTEQIEGTPTDVDHHYGVWWHSINQLPEFVWPDQLDLLNRHREAITSDILNFRA